MVDFLLLHKKQCAKVWKKSKNAGERWMRYNYIFLTSWEQAKTWWFQL